MGLVRLEPSMLRTGFRARVTILLPEAQYRHRYAAKGRLSIDLGRGDFSFPAGGVGMAESHLVRAIALGSQSYAAWGSYTECRRIRGEYDPQVHG
jgi:hypothetical protein